MIYTLEIYASLSSCQADFDSKPYSCKPLRHAHDQNINVRHPQAMFPTLFAVKTHSIIVRAAYIYRKQKDLRRNAQFVKGVGKQVKRVQHET